jgi:hypothetical protein
MLISINSVADILGFNDADALGGGPRHDWAILHKLIHGVASGLQYLHNYSFVHMDLKPQNVQNFLIMIY